MIRRLLALFRPAPPPAPATPAWPVRWAAPGEALALAEVQKNAIAVLCARSYAPRAVKAWVNSLPASVFLRAFEAGERILVVEADRRIVAFAGRLGGEVRSCYVLPEAARRGIGRSLMIQIEAEARAAGLTGLRAAVTLNAIPFYEKLGWRRARRPEAEDHAHEGIRCIEMRKQLE